MVNGQSGEIYAYDGLHIINPNIFDNNSAPIISNRGFILKFQVPQNVTSVELQVPSDVISGEISYVDKEKKIVVSVYIIYFILLFHIFLTVAFACSLL